MTTDAIVLQLCQFKRRVTVEAFTPSLDRCLLTVSSQQFSEYITSFTGNFHVCYILEIDNTERRLVLLGVYSNFTDIDVAL